MLATPSLETGNRFNFPSEPEKISADEVKSVVEEFIAQEKIEPQAANAILARLWFLRVDAFRREEERFMIEDRYETSLADHRYTLSKLIADGELILFGSKKFGLAQNSWNFGLADVEATLNSLHTTFRCEHGPKNSPKINERIKKLFDGAKS